MKKRPIINKTREPRNAQRDALHFQQDVPANGGGDLDEQIGEDAGPDPAVIRDAERVRHFRAFLRIVKDPVKDRGGDGELQDGEERFFHSPKRSFQTATDRRISSGVLRGLISQTNKQFGGRSGTSFSRSTMPAKGG